MPAPALAPLLIQVGRFLAVHLLASVVVKALFMAAVWFMFDAVMEGVWAIVPSFPSVHSAIMSLPPQAIWLLDFIQLPFGAPLVLSATMTAFVIRRLPVV